MRYSAVFVPLALAACAVEHPSAPPTAKPRAELLVHQGQATVLPASAYVVSRLFSGTPSDARDINSARQVVGQVKAHAFLYDLPLRRASLLFDGGVDSSNANAINKPGDVGGWVTRAGHLPAIWRSAFSLVVLKTNGEVRDLNDRAEAVGWTLDSRQRMQGLYWDVNAGIVVALPRPRGATWTRANGINNDRVIVGESDVGGVMWTGAPGAFVVRVLKGIRPLAVDYSLGTVGDNGNPVLPNALFGNPDSTGTFGWGASAENVNGFGVAAGVGYAFFNPFEAFVADRFGGVTVLPTPGGLWRAAAHAVNDCGVVAGNIWFGTAPRQSSGIQAADPRSLESLAAASPSLQLTRYRSRTHVAMCCASASITLSPSPLSPRADRQ